MLWSSDWRPMAGRKYSTNVNWGATLYCSVYFSCFVVNWMKSLALLLALRRWQLKYLRCSQMNRIPRWKILWKHITFVVILLTEYKVNVDGGISELYRTRSLQKRERFSKCGLCKVLFLLCFVTRTGKNCWT